MKNSGVVELKNRGTRPRGEQTRRKILDATLNVIAREGVRGTTHRAIAREAAVQLSLTTYYFRDLNELISLAFRTFMDRDYGVITEQWDKAFKYLDQFSPDELADPDTRRRIVDYCTKRVVDHVRHGLTKHPEGLAVEHNFFYEALNDPELQELSALHRSRLLQPMVRFCEYFNAGDPETDARLLFGTITRLEYQALPAAPDNVDYKSIRNEIRRMVGWIVNSD
ncbi:MAG: TetR family transcriptional regulator [Woeseiaceae bacterium]|nr:TetR family transcriptional regulator [Woeseiaceae bacterium]